MIYYSVHDRGRVSLRAYFVNQSAPENWGLLRDKNRPAQ